MTLFQIKSDHHENNYIFSIGLLNVYGGYDHVIGRYRSQWTTKGNINVLKEL